MEFIPIGKTSKKISKRPREEEQNDETEIKKSKKLVRDDESRVSKVKKLKQKPQGKVIQKKNVKNKYRETMTEKKKNKISEKNISKKVEEEEDDDEAENEENDADSDEEEEEIEEGEEDEDVEDEEENDEDEGDDDKDDAEAFKRKCKALDEKKKNRLFIKFPKKIHSEAQIKELHPDIKKVIFPRKKNTRWCWAVFASEEKADAVLKKLIKDKNVFASKPIPYDKVTMKLKEKMKTVLRKKEAKQKLQKMWM